jgi:metal-responsive CopG/Arc/MetJ family transcriptional regulator
VKVTLDLPKRLVAKADIKAKHDGTKRSEVMRRALKFYFDAEAIAKGGAR